MELAARIVADFHSPAEAAQAGDDFDREVRQGAEPADIETVPNEWFTDADTNAAAKCWWATGLAPSRTEAERLLKAGAVEIDGVRWTQLSSIAGAGTLPCARGRSGSDSVSRLISRLRPSRIFTVRCAKAAASGLWVIIRMVWPRRSFRSRKNRQHGFGIFGVEVAGGLVGQQKRRMIDDGAGDGHALLLAAGERARLVMHAPVDSQQLQDLLKSAVSGSPAASGDVARDRDVVRLRSASAADCTSETRSRRRFSAAPCARHRSCREDRGR